MKKTVARDPVEFVHRYAHREDIELVALVAAAVAFGNVTTLRAKLADALARIGPSPALAADDEKAIGLALKTWRHRLYGGGDLAQLFVGARSVQRAHGSLGECFATELRASGGDLREGLARFVDAIRERGGLARSQTQGARHLLADPRRASACKRLLLFLRWMVRPADGVDTGLWSTIVPASLLLIPIDVHIHKLSRNLGLTDRSGASWKAAEEITRVLGNFDPDDPVRFDFALCHMGMVQRCPSRQDLVRCDGCPVRPVCRWWAHGPPQTLPRVASRPKRPIR